MKFNFPWPLTDKWVVNKVRIDESNASKGEYKYEYHMEVGSLEKLEGKWWVLPVEGHPGWSEFRGSYRTDPGIAVPKFIMRAAAKSGFKKDIEAYRQILSKKK